MRKASRKTWRNKLDTLWAELIKNIGSCERCGMSNKQLQAAHIYSRRYVNTRWDLNNGVCLCAGCHRWAHDRPLDFASWVEEKIGGDIVAELSKQARALPGKFDYEGKYEELRDIKSRM